VSNLLERQLAPELARLSGVLGDVGSLAVELVVLGSGKLLGALGAVVAAAGAGRSAGKGLARCRAGDGSGGEHGEVCCGRWSGDGAQLVFRRVVTEGARIDYGLMRGTSRLACLRCLVEVM
jgi:hypothetical protein